MDFPKARHCRLHLTLYRQRYVLVHCNSLNCTSRSPRVCNNRYMRCRLCLFNTSDTDHLPINRNYSSHVGYLSGAESYYPYVTHSHDFWHDTHPAVDEIKKVYYSTNYYAQRAVDIVDSHKKTDPLFLDLRFQAVHGTTCCRLHWITQPLMMTQDPMTSHPDGNKLPTRATIATFVVPHTANRSCSPWSR